MFIVVDHEVKEEKRFFSCMQDALVDPPRDLHVVQFVAKKDGSSAYSLWVGASIDKVKEHMEACVQDAGTQDYHEVDEKHSSGLEHVEPHGAQEAAT